ncbi:SLC13 family permease [Aquimonas sp.]|jgi:sodium-dependent dicarboxylate transporter 2/3/5|uniref:SLC13 family permease n=1 Tax=Aquimonas sp. TaxID=1872588 RepID=UPI0037C01D76
MTGSTLRILAGPLAAALGWGIADRAGLSGAAAIALAVTAWCAVWWTLEAAPHAITALLPLAVFPLTGVLTGKQVAEAYGSELILLLVGGAMLSKALEQSNAHRRLALGMVRAFGGGGGTALVFGFAAAAGLTSMWLSNTATTLMLVPVALAILQTYPDRRLAVPLLLAICYGASIGGLGTPIGSPPNLVFMQVYQQTTGRELGFSDWMAFGLPTVALMLPLAALWLARGLRDSPPAVLPPLPAWSIAEKRVLLVFGIVALAWVTRTEPFGGWREALSLPGASDASVALLGVVAMALTGDGRGGKLLDWQSAERIPWGVMILFGGGIAIASAFQSSGLSDAAAGLLQGMLGLPLLLTIALVAISISLLSEINSNTATAVLAMPILAAAAVGMGLDPAVLMAPAVLSASCSFMLPVGTAPNAIVFGTGQVPAAAMLRHGIALNVIGAVVITVVCGWWFG